MYLKLQCSDDQYREFELKRHPEVHHELWMCIHGTGATTDEACLIQERLPTLGISSCMVYGGV
jgi:hypothetical protein